MNRFIVHDEFGEPLRTFSTKDKAMLFIANKRGCTVREISLFEILGECLI